MTLYRKRIIPVLLLDKDGLYKTHKYKNPVYVGDPINAVRLFNDKEVDELALLDIGASKKNQEPDYQQIMDITSEAFMPLAYGGGIKSIDQVEKLFFNGIEKVILNTSILQSQSLITEIASRYGNQSVIASIDVKKSLMGKKKVYSHASKKVKEENVLAFAKLCEEAGAGEIMLNAVDKEGTYSGYDLQLIKEITSSVSIPVIASGGASTKNDFNQAENAGASAMAAGSMFVFQRPNNAVLISYDI